MRLRPTRARQSRGWTRARCVRDTLRAGADSARDADGRAPGSGHHGGTTCARTAANDADPAAPAPTACACAAARPRPDRDPWRPERARTAEELQALADTIHRDIAAHLWSSAAEIAHRLNVPVKELQIPMFLLRGMTPRRKPSGEPERIQIRGEKQAARYAVVGAKPPR